MEFPNVAGITLSGGVDFAISESYVDLQTGAGTFDNVKTRTFALGVAQPVVLAVEDITAAITSGNLAVATIKLADGTEYFGLKARDVAATITGVLSRRRSDSVKIDINKATDSGKTM